MTVLAYITGKSSPSGAEALSAGPLAVGQYVVIRSGEGDILGLVDRSETASALLADVSSFAEAKEGRELAEKNRRDKTYKSHIMIMGFVEGLQRGSARVPAVPPMPGDEVARPDEAALGAVFGPDCPEWVRIGSLLRSPDVAAKVNLNKVVSRHLGILAMTGMGKSNLVALVAKQANMLNGTVIIFDYHDDYGSLRIPNVNIVSAKINPRRLDPESLAEVLEIRDNANVQQRILRIAATKRVRESSDYWSALNDSVDVIANTDEKNKREYAHSGARVRDKIEDARHKFADVLDPDTDDPVGLIREGKVNVINISGLSEKQANVGLAYYLQEMLYDRKEATRARLGAGSARRAPRFSAPVLAVIEEAHVFIPKGESTQAKYWAAKIAREGRKFGLGLAVVSQRPRSIDSGILSQMGSLAVMRMVQQDDQSQVAAAAESLSSGLLEQLSSLNVGDAVLAGQWANLPAIVHIDEVAEKPAGADQDAVSEWQSARRDADTARGTGRSMIREELMD